MKRILVCQFHQESNTFNPIISNLDRFHPQKIYEGETVFGEQMKSTTAIRGAVELLRQEGVEVIPTVFMRAPSGGRVDDKVLTCLKERLEDYASRFEFDGIFASLHGATCMESCDDACGNLVEFLRKLAGKRPIAATFDLHANITDRMLKNADVVCGYHTYPHVDFYEVGQRAARLLLDRLNGKSFDMIAADVPALLPPAGYTTLNGAFKELMDRAVAMVDQGKLLDVSIFPVQPWLDIKEISSRIVAVSEDGKQAERFVKELAQGLFDLRDAAQPELYGVDEIIDIAEKNTTGKPVILADSADSPNGGCIGDSPVVAMRLLERKSALRAGMFIVDPAGVKKAYALGVGGKGSFRVGAGFTKGMPGPLQAQGVVRSLHDGHFRKSNDRGSASVGRCAVVCFGNIDVLLCERGASSGDPNLYRSFGMDPKSYDLLVVKANTSFRVPYRSISDLIYVADTPGAGASNLKRCQWENLVQNVYPFTEPDFQPEAKLWHKA